MVAGPCGSPPGTYDEDWIAYGKFSGNVNGNSASANLCYQANVKAGGEINGLIMLSQGPNGELHVFGNPKNNKLSYTESLE